MTDARAPLPSHVGGLAALPDSARDTLNRGLRALGLSDVAPDRRQALEDHLRLLLAWTSAINLTAIRDPETAVRLHLLDSLSAIPLLRSHGIESFIDLGSGGGFPGLPLAIVLPAERALLVDSVAKKARFVRTVAAALDLPQVEVMPDRIERLADDPGHRARWPAVLARAVGALPELVELALPLLAPGGLLIAWKRLPIEQELAAAEPAVEALGGGPPVVVPAEASGLAFGSASGSAGLSGHVLVAIEKVRSSPPGYPRDPAERRRRPW